MLILLYCVFVVHSLAYGLRPIKDYLTLKTYPNFLISIYVYPQTITITIKRHWNTHRLKHGAPSEEVITLNATYTTASS
ncbi:hypothetical protein EB796_022012 [Bugula neritina]|uniref:Secreted protein n=1 Tax=Bugula neritina TaxID=10212 RepID=A0A7J7J0D9_BUGNE|nr:hypothetical protein EB796_022012 [Bugula neritina]